MKRSRQGVAIECSRAELLANATAKKKFCAAATCLGPEIFAAGAKYCGSRYPMPRLEMMLSVMKLFGLDYGVFARRRTA
jgi:hypothetical protein